MDFFQAQRSARRRTWLLVLLFAVAVAAIVAANYVAVHLFVYYANWQDAEVLLRAVEGRHPPFPDLRLLAGVAAATLFVILSGTAYRTASLRRGGPAVAELVGGRVVDPSTTDIAERRLLNVVEEMAIASGVPVPAVYVLDEDGINAFAAGHTIHDAAVGVTRGTLERLDRDELQGVVAHEFSHILNGDMRLNVRLIGLLFGILLLTVIGRSMIGGRRYSSRRGRVGGSAALVALALIVIGYVGVLLGRLIKAAVSRQREFLADASAVQFTRNPEGVAGALKKIGGYGAGSRVRAGHAEELSHLFFANAVGRTLFATHPPLVDRIRRIDPRFDGEFPELEATPTFAETPEFSKTPGGSPGTAALTGDARETTTTAAATEGDGGWSWEPRLAAFAGGAPDDAGEAGGAPADAGATADAGPPAAAADASGERSVPGRADDLVASIGEPTAEHVSYASRLLEALPAELRAAARTPGGAQTLVLALLIDADDDVARRQREAVRGHGGGELLGWVDDLVPSVREQPREARLALLDLALPALTRLPPESAAGFRDAVHELIRADGRLHLFEYALFRVLARHLHPAAGRSERRRRRTVRSLASLREEVALVLSAVARSGATGDAEARAAFEAGTASLPDAVGELRLRDRRDASFVRIDRALRRLDRASLGVRRRFLEACARCVAHDGRIRPSEVEILRAVAEGLDCPMPPLMVGAGAAPRTGAVAGG